MKEPGNKPRVIREGSGDARQWMPPDVDHRGGGSRPKPQASNGTQQMPTAAQLEKLQKQAHDEGFEQGRQEGQSYGHNEGLEEGREKVREMLGTLDGLLEKLDQPFEDLDDQVESEIVSLVISMVRQLVRREIRMDPKHVVGVVREALAILPVNSRNIRVILHPEDADLVREAYTMGDIDQKWQIVEDPVVQRGGCRVTTDTSQVDATLESRLNALIAPLLAGERRRDASDEAEADHDAAGD